RRHTRSKRDWSSDVCSSDLNHFGLTKQFYSFDYQNVHILTMSTEIPFATGSEQYNFVKDDLASAASNPNINWIVVNFHRAMYLRSEERRVGKECRSRW